MEILAVAGGTALVLAVFFATIGAATGYSEQPSDAQGIAVESQAPQQTSRTETSPVAAQTYEGVVTDTRCEAKHSAPLAESAADCTRVCIHAGEHFALVDGDQLYLLEGEPEVLKGVAGERVTITGTLNGGTISVASVRSP